MKKFIAFILCGAALLTLAACAAPLIHEGFRMAVATLAIAG